MVLSKAIASLQTISSRKMGTTAHDLKAFTWTGMKKNAAVLPLVFIMGGAVIGLSGYIIYSCRTRHDVSFKRSNPQEWEKVDVLKPQPLKMLVFNQEYKPNEELKAALDAIEQK